MNKCLRIHAAQTGGFALFDENENGINPPPFAVVPDTEKMNEAVTLFFAEAVQVGDSLSQAIYGDARLDPFEKAGEIRSSSQRAACDYILHVSSPTGMRWTEFGFNDRDYAMAAAEMARAIGASVMFTKSIGADLDEPGDAPDPDFAEVGETAAEETDSQVFVVTFGPPSVPEAGMVVRYSHDDAKAIAQAVQTAGGTACIRAASYI